MSAPQLDQLSTVGEHGERKRLFPAKVTGRYNRLRSVIQIVLVGALLALPFVRVRGAPAVWLDVGHHRFFVLGAVLGPTDSSLLFFLLSGIGFALIVVSALWGRVWCGFACPQTVFLEGVYRRIERWVEGSAEEQRRLARSPWTFDKVVRAVAKQFLFVVVSALLAHVVSAYFIGAAPFAKLVREGPFAEPGVFAWIVIATGAIYFNFAWFREQLCIVICPYGRLQSALTDADTIVIGYDAIRGEPRGHGGQDKGDCIDCKRCIAVCPTGIDIRQGLQLECVGCSACVDACDDIMERVHKPLGLIRYDSERGLMHEARRFVRPRLYLYAALAVAGCLAFVLTSWARPAIPATLLRQPGPPFVRDGDDVRNAFSVVVHNNGASAQTYRFVAHAGAGEVVLPKSEWVVEAGRDVAVPLFVKERAGMHAEVTVVITTKTAQRELHAPFVSP